MNYQIGQYIKCNTFNCNFDFNFIFDFNFSVGMFVAIAVVIIIAIVITQSERGLNLTYLCWHTTVLNPISWTRSTSRYGLHNTLHWDEMADGSCGRWPPRPRPKLPTAISSGPKLQSWPFQTNEIT